MRYRERLTLRYEVRVGQAVCLNESHRRDAKALRDLAQRVARSHDVLGTA